MKKEHVVLQLMIVFSEEKRILRYCLFIEELFWILYQVHRHNFSGGGKEEQGAKNYKKDITISSVNKFNKNKLL